MTTTIKLTLATLSLLTVTLAVPALATPGAVNKQGCHSKPRHCHAKSELRKFEQSNRYYVPFSDRG